MDKYEPIVLDNLRKLAEDGGIRRSGILIIGSSGDSHIGSIVEKVRLRINEQNSALAREADCKNSGILVNVEFNQEKVQNLVDNMISEWKRKFLTRSVRQMGKTQLALGLANAIKASFDVPQMLAENEIKQPRRNGKQKRNPDRWK